MAKAFQGGWRCCTSRCRLRRTVPAGLHPFAAAACWLPPDSTPCHGLTGCRSGAACAATAGRAYRRQWRASSWGRAAPGPWWAALGPPRAPSGWAALCARETRRRCRTASTVHGMTPAATTAKMWPSPARVRGASVGHGVAAPCSSHAGRGRRQAKPAPWLLPAGPCVLTHGLHHQTPAADDPCASQCAPSPFGTRLLHSQAAPYYEQPCQTSPSGGTLQQCALFHYTGRSEPSNCEEGLCYAEVVIGARTRWVVDGECGSTTSRVGMPGQGSCPDPGAGRQPAKGHACGACRQRKHAFCKRLCRQTTASC